MLSVFLILILNIFFLGMHLFEHSHYPIQSTGKINNFRMKDLLLDVKRK